MKSLVSCFVLVALFLNLFGCIEAAEFNHSDATTVSEDVASVQDVSLPEENDIAIKIPRAECPEATAGPYTVRVVIDATTWVRISSEVERVFLSRELDADRMDTAEIRVESAGCDFQFAISNNSTEVAHVSVEAPTGVSITIRYARGGSETVPANGFKQAIVYTVGNVKYYFHYQPPG